MDDDLFQKKWTAAVLIYIDDHPDCLRTEVLDALCPERSGRRSVVSRMLDLRDAGYLSVICEGRHCNRILLRTTESGRKAATLIRMIREV